MAFRPTRPVACRLYRGRRQGGGSAINEGGGPEGIFFASGGAGEDGREFVSGRDGCDLVERDGILWFCGTGFEVVGTTFRVVAVNTTHPMAWDTIRMATVEQDFILRTPEAQAPFDSPAALPSVHVDASDRPVWAADLNTVFPGKVRIDDAFEVCGLAPGTLNLWVWDARPIGAMFGARLDADGCDGTPWTEPKVPETFANNYTLEVTGPEGQTLGYWSKNCVSLPDGAAFSVLVEAEWAAQTPLAQALEFSLMEGTGDNRYGTVASAQGVSPFRHTFTGNGTDPMVAVFPAQVGASLEQEVRIRLTMTLESSPEHLWASGPGACVRSLL